MKHIFYAAFSLFTFMGTANAQLVSYTLQQSFTAQQLDRFLNTTGFSFADCSAI
ncbi:MAG: hypothetical protein IPN22_11085 [Bacteroidetes bacterium]|nr:hypothetical protein [Bacteroidota bacterium]